MVTIYEWLVSFFQAWFVPIDPIWETLDHMIQVFCFILMIIIIFLPVFILIAIGKTFLSIGGGRYDE